MIKIKAAEMEISRHAVHNLGQAPKTLDPTVPIMQQIAPVFQCPNLSHLNFSDKAPPELQRERLLDVFIGGIVGYAAHNV